MGSEYHFSFLINTFNTEWKILFKEDSVELENLGKISGYVYFF